MTDIKEVIGLIGNPNTGKSSLFNHLTGLHQKVANFPGVTVEKKTGTYNLHNKTYHIVDFPGIYSLFPNSGDERVPVNVFCNIQDPDFPDLIVYVADVTQLQRHLLLLTQLTDLGVPCILVLNMWDLAESEGLTCDTQILSQNLGIPVVKVSTRTGFGLEELKEVIAVEVTKHESKAQTIYALNETEEQVAKKVQEVVDTKSLYQAKLIAHHVNWLSFLNDYQIIKINKINSEYGFEDLKIQIFETMQRYNRFISFLQKSFKKQKLSVSSRTEKVDQFLTHSFWGPIVFIALLVLMFQAVFSWASYPMDFIDSQFSNFQTYLSEALPKTWLSSLLTDGILPGLSGIVVFVPQIAILFLFISILEELGYMARAVYLFDGLMQKIGLNGRSLVSLVSAGACAIPAIMSTRTIPNHKERLITILVSPFISCSARIPVYAILVGLVVPPIRVAGGLFQLQGLVFASLYLMGIFFAVLSSIVLSKWLDNREVSSFVLELPPYRYPNVKNIALTVYEKVMTFVKEAGTIIFLISLVLWGLSSFGPGDSFSNAEQHIQQQKTEKNWTDAEAETHLASEKLKVSYAGHLGRAIEPVIAPLGFDWKIGIALITSFAAREVFVGTMATIYSLENTDDDDLSLKQKMSADKRSDGSPVYTLATALSLLVFYALAMQCMSTLAVTKRETKTWKWPILQFLSMGMIAYSVSFIVYQMFR